MPSVEAVGLVKSFNGVTVVNDVSFTIPDGSCTSLLGPSGCGKTTMLRMLAGFERPDAGRITIGDTTVVDASSTRTFVPPSRRNVGFVFQSYALWPHMTVFDQVAYPLRVRRAGGAAEVRRRVHEALALVELEPMSAKYPSQLSGGQQQRVALARALVFEPAVLLLDEPLSNLDAELRKQMRIELGRLHDRLRTTFIYVTHDKSEALALSDQVLVMKAGRVVERGDPRAVYARPSSVYSARFVSSANSLPATVSGVEGEDVVVKLAGGQRIVAAGQRLTAPEVGAAATVLVRPEDVMLAEATTGEPGLDEGVNTFPAVVRSSTYLGSHIDLVVGLADGSALQLNASPGHQHGEGDQVRVFLPPHALRLVA